MEHQQKYDQINTAKKEQGKLSPDDVLARWESYEYSRAKLDDIKPEESEHLSSASNDLYSKINWGVMRQPKYPVTSSESLYKVLRSSSFNWPPNTHTDVHIFRYLRSKYFRNKGKKRDKMNSSITFRSGTTVYIPTYSSYKKFMKKMAAYDASIQEFYESYLQNSIIKPKVEIKKVYKKGQFGDRGSNSHAQGTYNATTKMYTSANEDTYWSIAIRFYGDGSKSQWLIDNNRIGVEEIRIANKKIQIKDFVSPSIVKKKVTPKPVTPKKVKKKVSSGSKNKTDAKLDFKIVSWLSYLPKNRITDKGVLTKIRNNRKKVPNHSKKLSPVTFRRAEGKMYGGGKERSQPTQLAGKKGIKIQAQKAVWKELEKEGSVSSINSWDGEIFTWGRGISAKAGNLSAVLTKMFSSDVVIKSYFTSVGITVDASNVLRVVDTKTGAIKKGIPALKYIINDTKILSFFIEIGDNKSTQQQALDAQFDIVKDNAAKIPFYVYNSKLNKYKDSWSDASAALAAHLSHWLYAGSWKINSYKETKGDVLKIIQAFYLSLYKHKVSFYKKDSKTGKKVKYMVVQKFKNGAYINSYVAATYYQGIKQLKKFAGGIGWSALSKLKYEKISYKVAITDKKYNNHLLIAHGGKYIVIPVSISIP